MNASASKLSVIQGGQSEADSEWGSKKWANSLRTRAKLTVKKLEAGYMDLAKMLYQIWDTPVDGDPKNKPLFKDWGFDTFGEYVERELGFGVRKAERLKKIWAHLLELDLSPELEVRLIGLGWTKVRELVHVLTDRNAEEWISKAEHYTYEQIEDAVRKYGEEVDKIDEARKQFAEDDELPEELAKDAAIPDPEDFFPEKFRFAKAQYDNVMLALDKAKQLSHSQSKTHNFDLICTDFLASNDFLAAQDPDRIVMYLRKIERAFGIKIIAFDNTVDEIIYGNRTFDTMAEKSLLAEKMSKGE